MELFGIGILEILLIFALFAIIFGPHRLPEIAAQFGRAVRVLRAYARDFRDEYLTDIEEMKDEVLDLRQDLQATDAEWRREVQDVDEELRMAVREAERDAESVVREAKEGARGKESPPSPAGGNASRQEQAIPRRRFARRRARGSAPPSSRPTNVISIAARRPARGAPSRGVKDRP